MSGSPSTPKSNKKIFDDGDHTSGDGSGYDSDKTVYGYETPVQSPVRGLPSAPSSTETVRDDRDTYIYIDPNDKSKENILTIEYAANPKNAGKIYYDAEGNKFIFDKNTSDVVEYNELGSSGIGGKSKRRKSKRTKKQKKSKRRRTTKRRYYR